KNINQYAVRLSFNKLQEIPEKVFIVLSSENGKGKSILWKGYSLSEANIEKVINAHYLSMHNAEILKIFIWNKGGENFQLQKLKLERQITKTNYPNNNKSDSLFNPLLFGHRATGSHVKS